MGFDRQVQGKLLLEWRDHYIPYRALKLFFTPFKTTAKLLILFHKNNPQTNTLEVLDLSPDERSQLQRFYNEFTASLSAEVKRVNEFLDLQLRICENEWTLLKASVALTREPGGTDAEAELAGLQHVFHQLYLKLGYISSFVGTNEEVISHIQVKFNVLGMIFQDYLDFSGGGHPRSINVNPLAHRDQRSLPRLSGKPRQNLQRLLEKARGLYLHLYFDNFKRAQGERTLKALFRQTQSKIVPQRTMYSLYLFSGVAFVLAVMIVLLIADQGLDPDSDNNAKKLFKYQFPIFRGFLMIILYLALLSINVYGWMRHHLNYRAVFGFERHYSSESQILSRMMFFASVWLLTFFLFLAYLSFFGSDSRVLGILPIYYLGGLNWLFFLGYLFFPHATYLNGRGRAYFFRALWRVLTRSCRRVDFPMIFILNQFTSFVTALKDLEYTACFYISIWLNPEKDYPTFCINDSFQIGFLVSFLPLLMRIGQCLRIAYDRKDPRQKKLDLVNAFKFVTSGIVTILSLVVGKLKAAQSPHEYQVFELWVAMAAVSTIYSYTWDIKMGWALCQDGHGLLRAETYFSPWFYYAAILLNLVFRVTWILTISPDVINTVFWKPELSALALGFTEMIRRTIWNFIRVDKEAVCNKRAFGFVQDLALSINERSARASMEKKERKTLGKVSVESQSSFSMEDLMKRDVTSSVEDLKGLKIFEKTRPSEENDEVWEFVEDKRFTAKENAEEVRRAIAQFERTIKQKSKNNTLIGRDSPRKRLEAAEDLKNADKGDF